MIDLKLIAELERLIAEEQERASKYHGPYQSAQGGLSAIVEEFNELIEEASICRELLQVMSDVKDIDANPSMVFPYVRDGRNHAILAAAEAIQLAGVLQKFFTLGGGSNVG